MVDDEAEEDDVKTVSKKSEMLFVRGELTKITIHYELLPDNHLPGDSVVLISPVAQS